MLRSTDVGGQLCKRWYKGGPIAGEGSIISLAVLDCQRNSTQTQKRMSHAERPPSLPPLQTTDLIPQNLHTSAPCQSAITRQQESRFHQGRNTKTSFENFLILLMFQMRGFERPRQQEWEMLLLELQSRTSGLDELPSVQRDRMGATPKGQCRISRHQVSDD